MGLFNKILKGLGFEDEGDEQPNVQKVKEKKDKKKNTITASFDLENINEDDNKSEEVKLKKTIEDEIPPNNAITNFKVVKVNSQTDVQNAVKMLKDGTKILINIEGLNDGDIIRSLDFITGAVFALGLNMQKIDEKIFLIQ